MREQIHRPLAKISDHDTFRIAPASGERPRWTCERGVIGVTFALSLPVMIGFGALALDASIWLSDKNAIQGAADAAALSAITALGAGDANTHIYNEVYTVAALNGFTNGQGGVRVYPYCPPNDGPNTGNRATARS